MNRISPARSTAAALWSPALQPGEFVAVRARRWLVDSVEDGDRQLPVIALSCIDDDAQGEPLSILWDAEINPRLIDDDPWAQIGRDGTDDAAVFAAFLRTLKWRTASAWPTCAACAASASTRGPPARGSSSRTAC